MKTLTALLIILTALSASAQTNADIYSAWAGITNVWTGTNSTDSSRDTFATAWAKINHNALWLDSQVRSNTAFHGSLEDAHTNSVLNSGKYLAWSTNGVTLDITPGSRWIFPSPATNFNSLSFDAVGQFSVNWSTNGTNWSTGIPGPRLGVVWLSFLSVQAPGFAVPVTPVANNIEVYSMSRPDLFGRTNNLAGQILRVSAPVNESDAASKGYVDRMVAAVNFPTSLAGQPLNLSEAWVLQTGSNSVSIRYLGSNIVTVGNPTISYGTATGISLSNTTVTVTVWTNGITAPPFPQWTYDVGRPAWSVVTNWSSTYPTAVGTNYVLTFPMPDPAQAFVRIGYVGASSPTIAALNAVLMMTPRTVTNSTDTTWGYGAGLWCSDSNYIYRSVGTNLWKRSAITAW